jgi:hypothetical protein
MSVDTAALMTTAKWAWEHGGVVLGGAPRDYALDAPIKDIDVFTHLHSSADEHTRSWPIVEGGYEGEEIHSVREEDNTQIIIHHRTKTIAGYLETFDHSLAMVALTGDTLRMSPLFEWSVANNVCLWFDPTFINFSTSRRRSRIASKHPTFEHHILGTKAPPHLCKFTTTMEEIDEWWATTTSWRLL